MLLFGNCVVVVVGVVRIIVVEACGTHADIAETTFSSTVRPYCGSGRPCAVFCVRSGQFFDYTG